MKTRHERITTAMIEALEELVAEFDAKNNGQIEEGRGFNQDTGGIALARTVLKMIHEDNEK